jgi:DNA-binding beta-propeller fold protein YncE
MMGFMIRLASAAVVAAVTLVSATPASAAFEFASKWGSLGSGPGQLEYPFGVAQDSLGFSFVADARNDRVAVFDPDNQFVRSFGGLGSAPGKLEEPLAIDIGPDRNIYVSDSANDRISVFTATGAPVRTIGSSGSGPTQLNDTRGVEVTPGGKVYVGDLGNHRVQVFTLEGAHLQTIGSGPGAGNGQLNNPQTIAVDDSSVFVADFSNNRIERFGLAGNYVQQWPVSGLVRGVALDGGGNVWSSAADGILRQFTTNGSPLATVGTLGSADGQFMDPNRPVFCGKQMTVPDGANNRIQKFNDPGAFSATCPEATLATTAPPAGVGDKTPPVLVLLGSKTQRASRFVRLAVKCNEACTATGSGAITTRKRAQNSASLKLRGAELSLVANQERSLKLKLSTKKLKAVRRTLKRRGRATASLTVQARDAAGNAATVKRTIKLKRR